MGGLLINVPHNKFDSAGSNVKRLLLKSSRGDLKSIMGNERFGGDKKVGKSILSSPENKFKYWAVPKIPKKIERSIFITSIS